MMRASLFLSEEAGIFDGDGNLPGGGLHDFEITRFEEILAVVAHRRHNTGGLIGQQDRRGTYESAGAAQLRLDVATALWVVSVL